MAAGGVSCGIVRTCGSDIGGGALPHLGGVPHLAGEIGRPENGKPGCSRLGCGDRAAPGGAGGRRLGTPGLGDNGCMTVVATTFGCAGRGPPIGVHAGRPASKGEAGGGFTAVTVVPLRALAACVEYSTLGAAPTPAEAGAVDDCKRKFRCMRVTSLLIVVSFKAVCSLKSGIISLMSYTRSQGRTLCKARAKSTPVISKPSSS